MATVEQTVSAVLDATNKRYVVETGQTENGWFTRYSDGWIEQGGRFGYGNVAIPSQSTVTFPIAFAELPTILIGGGGFRDIQTYESGIVQESISTSGFIYLGTANGNDMERNSFNWEAKGYAN